MPRDQCRRDTFNHFEVIFAMFSCLESCIVSSPQLGMLLVMFPWMRGGVGAVPRSKTWLKRGRMSHDRARLNRLVMQGNGQLQAIFKHRNIAWH